MLSSYPRLTVINNLFASVARMYGNIRFTKRTPVGKSNFTLKVFIYEHSDTLRTRINCLRFGRTPERRQSYLLFLIARLITETTVNYRFPRCPRVADKRGSRASALYRATAIDPHFEHAYRAVLSELLREFKISTLKKKSTRRRTFIISQSEIYVFPFGSGRFVCLET